MGYNDIKDRMEFPLYTPEGIKCCVDSCLKEGFYRLEDDDRTKTKKKGLNFAHSKSMMLPNHRSFIKTETITLKDLENFTFDMIKYLALSLYNEFLTISKNRYTKISDVAPGFIAKNPELSDYLISDLLDIANMSTEEIGKRYKSNDKSSIFIKKAYDSIKIHTGLINDFGFPGFIEHAFNNPLYEFDIASETDVGLNPNAMSKALNYSKRFYFNMSKDINGLKFVAALFKKCIDKRIPCDIKPFFSDGDDLDGTIVYAHNGNFDKMIDAVEEVIAEHPDLLVSLGSPILTAASVRSKDGNVYYSICHGGGNKESFKHGIGGTYNTIANKIINTTYALACIRLIFYRFPAFSKHLLSIKSEFGGEIYSYLYHMSELLKNPSDLKMEDIIKITKFSNSGAIKRVRMAVSEEVEKDRNKYNELIGFFSNYLPIVTSAINFCDLDHQDVPMPKDASFLSFEQHHFSSGVGKGILKND